SEGKTGRGPNGRGTGMNQAEGETDLGENEIGQPDSDQASNIVQSSAEACPRGNRMSIRNCRSHRLYAGVLDDERVAKTLLEFLRDRTRNYVGSAARSERHPGLDM